jgi:hypothetical protein
LANKALEPTAGSSVALESSERGGSPSSLCQIRREQEMDWSDLSPEARDFIVRMTMELLKRTGRAAADYLVHQFQTTFQAPEKRVVADIRKLALQIERAKKAPTLYQAIWRPRAERRDLLRMTNLLNLFRHWMIRQKAFYFIPIVARDGDAILLFQTARSYLTRDRIDKPGIWVASRPSPLRQTKPWKIERPIAMILHNDIEGPTNRTIFMRWIKTSDVHTYIPFIKETDVRACSHALNVLWRLNNQIDPWPQSVPTIHKIGIHTIATYNNYMPGETLIPNLMTVLDNHPHRFDDTLEALGAGLLIGAIIQHPDFNARLMLQ